MPDRQADGRPWPRIAVVTPSFEQGQYLEETIRSVLLQGYPELDYVVMDGGSADGSAGIIQRYARWLTHWESGRDDGQSDAIVRGVEKTAGDWWNWLNSDDTLMPGALAAIATRAVDAGPDISAIAGICAVVGADGAPTGRRFKSKVPRGVAPFLQNMHEPVLPQPSTFLRAGLIPDKTLHYVMDWALYLEIVASGGAVLTIPDVISAFRQHAGSKTSQGALPFHLEALHVMERMRAEGRSLDWACRLAIHRLRARLELEQAQGSIARLLRLASDNPVMLGDRMYWGAARRCIQQLAFRGIS